MLGQEATHNESLVEFISIGRTLRAAISSFELAGIGDPPTVFRLKVDDSHQNFRYRLLRTDSDEDEPPLFYLRLAFGYPEEQRDKFTGKKKALATVRRILSRELSSRRTRSDPSIIILDMSAQSPGNKIGDTLIRQLASICDKFRWNIAIKSKPRFVSGGGDYTITEKNLSHRRDCWLKRLGFEPVISADDVNYIRRPR